MIAGGVGGMLDVTDRVFVHLGVGYQLGLQKMSGRAASTSYVRVALGGGVRL